MTSETQNKTYTLQLKRVFAAPPEKVFRAWTNPEELKKWWAVEEAWTTPIAEVDLRIGGAFRLGMKSPENDIPYVVGGTYREIQPPEKLVYTWRWEGEDTEATPVTVEFHDLGDSTEVILKHEYFSDEKSRDDHNKGWNGCLDQLAKIL